MIFRQSIRFQAVSRIVLILVFTVGGVVILASTSLWLLSIWFFLAALVAVISLVRFLEKDRRVLLSFLTAVKQGDFTGNIGLARDQQYLYSLYNELQEKFRQIASDKQAEHHFLNILVEHAGVPLLVYEEQSQIIKLANAGAKALFKKQLFLKLSGLESVDPGLTRLFYNMKDGESTLYRFSSGDTGYQELSVTAKIITLQEESYKLIALHNIKEQLDSKELEAWQKLIRVLTHEIKNSVIPIASLSDLLNQLLQDEQGEQVPLQDLTGEDEEDLRIGLKTISKRSRGLTDFVASYSRIASVPNPKKEVFSLAELLDRVCALYGPLFQAEKKMLTRDPSGETLPVCADPAQTEQVFINLLKNGMEALQEGGSVHLKTGLKGNMCIVTVQDNGEGIPEENLENIFTPFYTTKDKGSGIGLSLSRQIMRNQGGDIHLVSKKGKGTSVTVSVPLLQTV